MRIQANQPSFQANKNAFMETFSRVLNDEEESRLYDKALDTFYEKGLEADGSLGDGVPPILAAHTFKEAKSSLSELMPKADLAEIREATSDSPEVAKWVSLLDTSSEFLKGVAERAPTTLTPNPQPWQPAPQPWQPTPQPLWVARPAETREAIDSQTVKESQEPQDYSQAKKLISQAASLSQQASSGYTEAETGAAGAASSIGNSTQGMSYSEEREVGLAILGSGPSAESSGDGALQSAKRAVELSWDSENAMSSALRFLSDHQSADRLRHLFDSSREAREHAKDGISDLYEADSHLRSAMSTADYLANAAEEEQLALDSIEAASDAGESGSAFDDGAYDFQDAAREQQRVSEGLREILSSLG
jgi:hypothetical protein